MKLTGGKKREVKKSLKFKGGAVVLPKNEEPITPGRKKSGERGSY